MKAHITKSQLEFILSKFKSQFLEYKIVYFNEDGKTVGHLNPESSGDMPIFADTFYILLKFDDTFVRPYTCTGSDSHETPQFIDDELKFHHIKTKVEAKATLTAEESHYYHVVYNNFCDEKYDWYMNKSNIYKLATKYNLYKSLEKESVENLHRSKLEIQEHHKFMDKIKNSERIVVFDYDEIRNYIIPYNEREERVEQLSSHDLNHKSQYIIGKTFNYVEFFSQGEIQYLLYRHLCEIQISFFEVQTSFPDIFKSINQDGILKWSFVSIEDFLLNNGFLEEETFYLHTHYKSNDEVDNPFLEKALNLRDNSLSFYSILSNHDFLYGRMRDYYGDEVMWYFSFMSLLIKWLALPGLLSFVYFLLSFKWPLMFTSDSVPIAVLSLVVSVWSIIFVTNWSWYEEQVMHKLYNIPSLTGRRYLNLKFRGYHSYDIETDMIEYRIEPHSRIPYFIYSVLVTLVFLLIASTWMVCGLNLNGYVDSESFIYIRTFSQFTDKGRIFDPDQDSLFWTIVPGIIQSIVTSVINGIYRSWAWHLSQDIEQWKYIDQAEYSYAIKRVFFENFDCFIPLFYVVFIRQQMGGLYLYLYSLYLSDQIRRVVTELFIPWVMVWWQHKSLNEKYNKDTTKSFTQKYFNAELEHKDSIVQSALATKFEELTFRKQIVLDEYVAFDDYIEIVATFGYFVLFSSSFPSMLWLSLLFFFVESSSDNLKLRKCIRRPQFKFANGIHIWNNVLKFFVLTGIVTNGFMFFYTTAQYFNLMYDVTGCKWEKRVSFEDSAPWAKKAYYMQMCEMIKSDNEMANRYYYDIKNNNYQFKSDFEDANTYWTCYLEQFEDSIFLNEKALSPERSRVVETLIFNYKCSNSIMKQKLLKKTKKLKSGKCKAPKVRSDRQCDTTALDQDTCVWNCTVNVKLDIQQSNDGALRCYGPKMRKKIAFNSHSCEQGGCYNYADNIELFNTCYDRKFNPNFNKYCKLVTQLNEREDDFITEFIEESSSTYETLPVQSNPFKTTYPTFVLKDFDRCMMQFISFKHFSLEDCEWVAASNTIGDIVLYYNRFKHYKISNKAFYQIRYEDNEFSFNSLLEDNGMTYDQSGFYEQDVFYRNTFTNDDYIYLKYKFNIYYILEQLYIQNKVSYNDASPVEDMDSTKLLSALGLSHKSRLGSSIINHKISGSMILNSDATQLKTWFPDLPNSEIVILQSYLKNWNVNSAISNYKFGFENVPLPSELESDNFNSTEEYKTYISERVSEFELGKSVGKFGYSSNNLVFSQSYDIDDNKDYPKWLSGCNEYLENFGKQSLVVENNPCSRLYREDITSYSFYVRDSLDLMNFYKVSENMKYTQSSVVGNTRVFSLNTKYKKYTKNFKAIAKLLVQEGESENYLDLNTKYHSICLDRKCLYGDSHENQVNGMVPFRLLLRYFTDIHWYLQTRIYQNTLSNLYSHLHNDTHITKPFIFNNIKLLSPTDASQNPRLICTNYNEEKDECFDRYSLDIRIVKILGEPPNGIDFPWINEFYMKTFDKIHLYVEDAFEQDIVDSTICCYFREHLDDNMRKDCSKSYPKCDTEALLLNQNKYVSNSNIKNKVELIKNKMKDWISYIPYKATVLANKIHKVDKFYDNLNKYRFKDQFKAALYGDNKDSYSTHPRGRVKVLTGYFAYIAILFGFYFLYSKLQFSDKRKWVTIKNKRAESKTELKRINDFEIIKSKAALVEQKITDISTLVSLSLSLKLKYADVTTGKYLKTPQEKSLRKLALIIKEFSDLHFLHDELEKDDQSIDYANMDDKNKAEYLKYLIHNNKRSDLFHFESLFHSDDLKQLETDRKAYVFTYYLHLLNNTIQKRYNIWYDIYIVNLLDDILNKYN